MKEDPSSRRVLFEKIAGGLGVSKACFEVIFATFLGKDLVFSGWGGFGAGLCVRKNSVLK
jgi:hypothetical protein